MVLKKVMLDNMLTQEVVFSKLIRGNLDFTIETHTIEGGRKLQIYLYRNHPRTKELIEVAHAKGMITTQYLSTTTPPGVLRLFLNDEKFMINYVDTTIVNIKEYNFNPGDIQVEGFPKGKAAIEIELDFGSEVDNAKVKKELKDFNQEEQNVR